MEEDSHRIMRKYLEDARREMKGFEYQKGIKASVSDKELKQYGDPDFIEERLYEDRKDSLELLNSIAGSDLENWNLVRLFHELSNITDRKNDRISQELNETYIGLTSKQSNFYLQSQNILARAGSVLEQEISARKIRGEF